MIAAQQRAAISGHGHVWPRADGVMARCGGPALCPECARDQASKLAAESPAGDTDLTRALRQLAIMPWAHAIVTKHIAALEAQQQAFKLQIAINDTLLTKIETAIAEIKAQLKV